MSGKRDNIRWRLFFATTWIAVSVAAPSAGATDYINRQSEYPALVPDTGQTRCYDNHKEIPCPGPEDPFYGQDGSYSINAPVYELKKQNGIETVLDRTTGLEWQRIPDGTKRTWSEAIDYTDALNLSGFSDWRLPQKNELQSILSYGMTPSPLLQPTETTESNEPRPGNTCAWTLTTRVFPSLYAKALCLGDNQGVIRDKYEKDYVYAVRGPALTYGKFQDNGNGTVTDQMTGLMWQAIEIRPEKWQQALAYCRQLELGGYSDWRLPTIKELSTLVNESRANPATDTTFFPGTRSAAYWSSTTFAQHPGFAWYVRFDDGLEYNGGYKGRRYFVRAVRGGRIAATHPLPSTLPRPDQEAKGTELKNMPALERNNREMLEPYPLDPDAQYK